MKERDLIAKARTHIHQLGGVFHKNTGGPFAERGWPDADIVLQGCPPIYVEFKVPGNSPTAAQILQIARLQRAGAIAFVCGDIDDFRRHIDRAMVRERGEPIHLI